MKIAPSRDTVRSEREEVMLQALALLVSLLPQPTVSAAILGEKDDRIEMFELSSDWLEAAQATIALSPARKIVKVHQDWKTFSNNFTLSTDPSLSPSVHPQHRFATQPIIAECTGFMVSSEILITASHCLGGGELTLVSGLGYTSGQELASAPRMLPLRESQISKLGQVLYAGTPSTPGQVSETDFAIVRLRTPLADVKPLVLQKSFSGAYPKPVAILGYQLGLPLKADLHGKLAADIRGDEKVFQAFMDTGGGNSGGPVFDPETRGVIGILVSSRPDWGSCASGPYLCESRRAETVEQLESDSNVPRSVVRSFWKNYPSGVITAWASQVIRIDAVVEKLVELGVHLL